MEGLSRWAYFTAIEHAGSPPWVRLQQDRGGEAGSLGPSHLRIVYVCCMDYGLAVACASVLDPPFRPKPGWLECLRKLQDNIMLNNTLSQLSRGCPMWLCVCAEADDERLRERGRRKASR